MQNNLFEKLSTLTHMISIVHHIPGRVRLKFNPAILKELGDDGVSQLENMESALPGIRDFKLNKMAKSVTINYDVHTLPMEFFEELVNGNITPEIERYWKEELS